MAFLVGLCPTPDLLPAERAWVRSTWHALKLHMIGTTAYVNALEKQERDRVRETYGHKYQRLAAIKAKYDPQTSSTATPTSSRHYRHSYRAIRVGFPATPTARSTR
jgi:hypothetical protein